MEPPDFNHGEGVSSEKRNENIKKINTNDFEKIFAVFSRNNLIKERIEKKKKGGKKNED